MSQIRTLEPKLLWGFFADICDIPHPSKHEEKAVVYLVEFAKKLGLWCETDSVGNVLIRKPATPGFENRESVVLQAHIDMVPQKNADTVHDFTVDPILPVVDGDWVKATGTTLGADNGIGVAAALAVLASNDVEHGPVEVLITIDEETGMTGANNLSADWLQSRILINMDSEDEGELFIGCAGGRNSNAMLEYSSDPAPSGSKSYRLLLSGLKGGHSGLEIHLGRANSNKLMVRFLWEAVRQFDLCLSQFHGGNMRNAIPREAVAHVTVPADHEEAFLAMVEEYETMWNAEYARVETTISFKAEPILPIELVMDKASEGLLLNALYALPNGAFRMIPGTEVVETSSNLSIIRVADGQALIMCLLRSSVDSARQDAANAFTSTFELIGAMVEHTGDYPGWSPDFDSPILKTMQDAYREKFGKESEVKIVHAGLECGIIGGIYHDMDMISFGPTIRHPHSPDEKVHIGSVALFWEFLTEVLTRVPLSQRA